MAEEQNQLSTQVQSGISGVDFTKYFLASNTQIGEASVYYEPLIVPELSHRESELFSICTPGVRATALECFVRLCFMQHLIYSAKYNLIDSIMKKRGIETQTQNACPRTRPSCR